MTASNEKSRNEAEVRELIENWAQAVRAKNIDGILANHAPEILMFDVPPPSQSKGIEAYKKTWDFFFAWARD
jgi:ketosteroid isomerase-like protein